MLDALKELSCEESDCLVIKAVELCILEEFSMRSQLLKLEDSFLYRASVSSVFRLFANTVQANDVGV